MRLFAAILPVLSFQEDVRGRGRGHVLGDFVAELSEIDAGEEIFSATKDDRRDCDVLSVDQTGLQVFADRSNAAARHATPTSSPVILSAARNPRV